MLNFYVRQLIDTISRVLFGLRFRLLLLVLLACAPLVGLSLRTASNERRHDVVHCAKSPAAHPGCAPGRRRAARSYPATAVGGVGVVRGAIGQSLSLQEIAGGILRQLPQLLQSGCDGRQRRGPGHRASLTEPRNQTDRDLVRRRIDTRAFASGGYPVGLASGKPTVAFGCPVFSPSGSVQAVAVAWMGLDSFTRPGSDLSAQVPVAANWTVVNRKGTMLARYPASEPASGEPFPQPFARESRLQATRGHR